MDKYRSKSWDKTGTQTCFLFLIIKLYISNVHSHHQVLFTTWPMYTDCK
jgi:hypothetical protein